MSDIATLHDRLNRLVLGNDPISGKVRDLMQPGIMSALGAMQSEIAETQLPRRLVFRNDRQEEISLEVASGRILRVSQPTSASFLEKLPDAMMEGVSQSTKAEIAQLIDIFKMFTSETAKLSFESQIPPHNVSMIDLGLSVDDLFQDIDIYKIKPTEHLPGAFLEGFLQDCASVSFAALLMKDDTCVFEYGSEGQLDALRTLVLAELSSNDTNLQPQDDPNPSAQCVIYTGHPQDGQAVLCASCTPNLAFLSFPCDMLETVLDLWASRNS